VALTTREEKARIFEMALDKVNTDLDVKRANAEATQKDFLDKIEAHTAHAKHSLSLEKMLREKNV
jgi:hypothetical protein